MTEAVPDKFPQRKHVRLKRWDYRRHGSYAITVCIANRRCGLGRIDKEAIILSRLGELVREAWCGLAQESNLTLDEFVIMPNHVHGILMITSDAPNVDTEREPSRTLEKELHGSLSAFIRRFKARATRAAHAEKQASGKVWQDGYYEHIIRDERDLANQRTYILNNVLQWEFDEENPAAAMNRGPTKT